MSYQIKDLPKEERPRERLIKYGVDALSNEELISIILKTGTKGIPVKKVSSELLMLFDSLDKMRNLEYNMLTNIKGIGKVKALELIAALELGRRVYYEEFLSKKLSVKNCEDIFNYFKYILKDNTQEKFYAIYLDTKKNVLGVKLLFIGTVNMSTVHPREIFKYAYLYSCSYIICVHNHPTGDVSPSNVDIELTNKLVDIGNIQKIPILDHIIIGDNKYYSFYENNKI
jgi:DNA repair protein RadC